MGTSKRQRPANEPKGEGGGRASGLAHEVVVAERRGDNKLRGAKDLWVVARDEVAATQTQCWTNRLRHPSRTSERKPARGWEGARWLCCGLEPDSGNPTVRDHRGAPGNTALAELGTHSSLVARVVTLRSACSALGFYPNLTRSCLPNTHPCVA